MHIQYLAVPPHRLPEGIHCHVEQHDAEVIILMDVRYVTQRMAEALTEAVNEHAQESWIHCASFGWDSLLNTTPG